MMEQTRLIVLIDGYLQDRITIGELAELNRLMEDPSAQAVVEDYIQGQLYAQEFNFKPDLIALKTRIAASINPKPKVKKMAWFRYAAAAILLFAIGGTFFLLQPTKPAAPLSQAERFKNDVAPGRLGALVKLSDGREILLDTLQDGQIAPGFTKTKDGLSVEKSNIQYATVIVPKARTERIALPDGTIVWLNAGSSITFPTRFSGNKREVSMTGEVYFEVAKDETRHFFVQTKTDRIEVKGTHFNINSYATVKTTLLEGSVQIGKTTIRPGDQYTDGRIMKPDLEEVMAWKNGRFLFNNTSITEIMAEVGRWYDVEVKYEGNAGQLSFGGEVERTENVSVLLKKLELTRSVEFTIDGRTITVKPITQ